MDLPLENKDTFRLILNAASSPKVANEYTHGLYRYPASLSPYLCRAIIETFTSKGDLVIDPFCGGGTTAIESIALGRRSISSDINSLAVFATRAKATPLFRTDIDVFNKWGLKFQSYKEIMHLIDLIPIVTSTGKGYAPKSSGLLHFLMATTDQIPSARARRFAKLAVLRTGQICFDSNIRKKHPNLVLKTFNNVVEQFAKGALRLHSSFIQNRINTNNRWLLRVFRSSAECVGDHILNDAENVKLVLTSPPYPGIHVLYHRWQYDGRKEIKMPYELLGLNDGNFESYYTMGPRRDTLNTKYFDHSYTIYSHLNKILPPNTPVVLVIAFPNSDYQLPKYTNVLLSSGLEPLWNSKYLSATMMREIPNRKWYIRTNSVISNVQETIFFMKTTER